MLWADFWVTLSAESLRERSYEQKCPKCMIEGVWSYRAAAFRKNGARLNNGSKLFGIAAKLQRLLNNLRQQQWILQDKSEVSTPEVTQLKAELWFTGHHFIQQLLNYRV